jgi:hypothetical protein
VDLLDADPNRASAVAYHRVGHDDWKLADHTYALTDHPNTATPITCVKRTCIERPAAVVIRLPVL